MVGGTQVALQNRAPATPVFQQQCLQITTRNSLAAETTPVGFCLCSCNEQVLWHATYVQHYAGKVTNVSSI